MAPSVKIDSAPQLALIIAPTVVLVFSTAAVALRFYARHIKRQKYRIEDFIALTGLIFAYGLHIDLCISVAYGGLGVSIETLEASNVVVYAKTIIAGGVLYGTAVTLLQTSILFLYVRIFSIVRWLVISCYIVMALCFAWWVAFVGGTLGDCVPLQKLWDPALKGTCVNQDKACGGTGIAHIILDLIILILPLPVIWNMAIETTRKILVSLVFTVGIFATVCSILRISCIVSLVKINSADSTYSDWMSYLFESLEVATGVLCICAISFPTVYMQIASSRVGSYARRLLTSLRRSRTTTTGQQSQSTFGRNESGLVEPRPSDTNASDPYMPPKNGNNSDIALVVLDNQNNERQRSF